MRLVHGAGDDLPEEVAEALPLIEPGLDGRAVRAAITQDGGWRAPLSSPVTVLALGLVLGAGVLRAGDRKVAESGARASAAAGSPTAD
ncbi:hypothetical protein [Streptomyces sp. B1I3]|uniref:hypothetical protein n=1 Tax=Streptomyces sp. B1I3 TaxID=3042264 RepID=UPI0027891D7D|nr:hypothetical protein [Streptomyces sp. B1I3]MDQ0797539.1 hypothetical protein [Streptomyces sp. B1I3]